MEESHQNKNYSALVSKEPSSIQDMRVQSLTRSDTGEISVREFIISILEWWRYLIAKWIIIITVCFIGGVLGFTYANSQQPIYKAELSFALEDEQGDGGLAGAAGLASLVGINVSSGGGAFSGDNLLELMKSRSMVQKALLTEVDVYGVKQTLAELYIDFNQFRAAWKNNPKLNNVHFLSKADRPNFSRTQDSLLGVFHRSLISGNLAVDKLDKQLSIIVVKVSSGNELFSKLFAEVLAKEVSDFYVESKTKKSVQNLAILQHQTDSVRRALNLAISGVAASVDVNPNPNAARQVLRVPSQRRQVDVQANQAILTELVKNLEISKVSLRKETPLIQIIDKPILPLEKKKIGVIKGSALGGLLAGFFTVIVLILKRIISRVLSS